MGNHVSSWITICVGVDRRDVAAPKSAPESARRTPTAANLDVDQIEDYYDIGKVLGEGNYGQVMAATHKQSKAIRAVKCIMKSATVDAKLKTEIEIHGSTDHPNIAKFYETFEEELKTFLVMELCKGGELFDRIIDAGCFSENQAAIVMQQACRAVLYLHQHHICHRDLKPDNFLFVSKDPIDQNTLKIIDFGIACKFETGQVLKTKLGTPYYVAPEVLQGAYDNSSDMWSLGVIMFVLLCGYPPFYGEKDSEVLAAVRKAHLHFDDRDWHSVSHGAKSLILKLLKKDPTHRYNAQQAVEDQWIVKLAPNTDGVQLQSEFVDKLRAFRSAYKLKKVALQIISKQLNDEQIGKLRTTFEALDADHNGSLTVNELQDGLKNLGITDIPQDLQQIMDGLDSDGSGQIDYTEFLAATIERKMYMQEDVCWKAFCVFDRNGDGKISKDELQLVLEDENMKSIAGPNLQEIMTAVDEDGDGTIDFGEFMAMMATGPTTLKA